MATDTGIRPLLGVHPATLSGALIECDDARHLFTRPRGRLTEDCIAGRFG